MEAPIASRVGAAGRSMVEFARFATDISFRFKIIDLRLKYLLRGFVPGVIKMPCGWFAGRFHRQNSPLIIARAASAKVSLEGGGYNAN